MKKTYQDRSQPKSWYQQTYSDTAAAEWFDRSHGYHISAETFQVRNPFETYLDFAEYDEDEVIFNGETQKAVAFNITFSGVPIVTVVNESADETSNVNIFVSSLSSVGMMINASATFTGRIIYRAIYSATYPIYVQRNQLSSSAVYYASAGKVNPAAPEFVISFETLGQAPDTVFFAPVDVSGSGTANVAVVGAGSLTETTLPVSLSAHIANEWHYLAVVPQ